MNGEGLGVKSFVFKKCMLDVMKHVCSCTGNSSRGIVDFPVTSVVETSKASMRSRVIVALLLPKPCKHIGVDIDGLVQLLGYVTYSFREWSSLSSYETGRGVRRNIGQTMKPDVVGSRLRARTRRICTAAMSTRCVSPHFDDHEAMYTNVSKERAQEW